MIEFDLKSLPAPYKEAFAMHELLRRLGFGPDDIYAMYSEGVLIIVLRSQGLEFSMNVGPLNHTYEEFEETWKKFLFKLKRYEIDEDALVKVWTESEVFKNKVNILFALVTKGFKLNPGATNSKFLN